MVYSTLSFSSVLPPPPPPRSCFNDPLEQKEGKRREILLLVWPKHTLLETLLKTLNFIDYSVMGGRKSHTHDWYFKGECLIFYHLHEFSLKFKCFLFFLSVHMYIHQHSTVVDKDFLRIRRPVFISHYCWRENLIFTLPFPIFDLVHILYSSSDPLDTDDQLFTRTAFTR